GQISCERGEGDVEAELGCEPEAEGPKEIRIALHPLALVVDEAQPASEVSGIAEGDEGIVGDPEDPPGEPEARDDPGSEEKGADGLGAAAGPSFEGKEGEPRRREREHEEQGPRKRLGGLMKDFAGHRMHIGKAWAP